LAVFLKTIKIFGDDSIFRITHYDPNRATLQAVCRRLRAACRNCGRIFEPGNSVEPKSTGGVEETLRILLTVRWMEEILRQLIGGLSHFIRFQPSKMVQDFFSS
jgi:hypothetical protein